MPSKEETASSRICPQCKNLLDANWKACPYCGRRTVTLPPICPHCKNLLKEDWQTCPYCGKNPAEQQSSTRYVPHETPSRVWYLAPLLFGIIGGLIGYVGTKDEDSDMASNLLIVGIFSSFLTGLVYWAWITSLIC